jgi:sporulation protein YlmC with PRC-barrel domain
MRIRTFVAAVAACGLLLGPAIGGAQQAAPAQQPQADTQPAVQRQAEDRQAQGIQAQVKTHMRSNELIGLQVRNNAGENLGDVNDLLVDLKSGEAKHVVLSFGGFLGIGTRLFAVPWDKAEFRHAEDDKYFVYNVTQEQLENAPSFERDMWPNVNDPQWHSSIDRHYGTTRQARQPAAQERPGRQDTVQPQQQQRATDAPAQPRPDVRTEQRGQVAHDTMYRASTVKDLRIRNQAGEDLGSINDLIVDVAQGKVNFATLTTGATLGIGGRTVAVPFDRFQIRHTEDDRYLVLNATEEQLKTAREFRREDLRDPNWVIVVERHYGPARTAEQPGETIRRE